MKCLACGKEMRNTVGGCYECECGFAVNDCVYRPNTSPSWIGSNENLWAQQGWVCPKCGAVLSPSTSYCPFCAPKNEKITFVTGTSTETLKNGSWTTTSTNGFTTDGINFEVNVPYKDDDCCMTAIDAPGAYFTNSAETINKIGADRIAQAVENTKKYEKR